MTGNNLIKIKLMVSLLKDRRLRIFAVFLFAIQFYGAFYLILPNHAFASSPPTNGLVGCWNFNDATGTTAYDCSGGRNTGALSGATSPAWVPGKHGGALSFDGSSSYIVVPTNSQLSAQTNFSVSAWVKFNSWYTGSCRMNIIAAKGEDNGNNRWRLGVVDAGWCGAATGLEYAVFTIVGSTGVAAEAFGTSYLKPGVWYHLTGTYDGVAAKVYVNAVFENSGDNALSFAANTDELRIGRNKYTPGGFDYWTNGLIDDVRIYNRALSDSEVNSLYKSGQTSNDSAIDMGHFTNGLVGYWTMDAANVNWTSENAGTATDVSGNSNTGTFTSMSRSFSSVTGKIKQGLEFDGSDDYVIFPDNASLKPTQAITLAAWINYDTTPANCGYVLSRPKFLYLSYGFRLCSNKKIAFTIGYDGTANPSTVSSLQALISGRWYHVVVTYNRQKQKVYINGALDNSIDLTSAIYYDNDAGSPVGPRLGKHSYSSNSNGTFFDGTMDDVRIYNRALSDAEIRSLYRMTLPSIINKTPVFRLNQGLVGYWTMDGKDTSQNISDVSGNGNNGLIQPTNATSSMKTTGKLGQALSFDGSNYVNIGDKDNLSFANNIFSISFWAKDIGLDAGLLQKNTNSSPPYEYAVFRSTTVPQYSGQLLFMAWDGTTGDTAYITYLIPPNDHKWHHYTWVSNGSVSTAFLDGVASTTNAKTAHSLSDTAAPFTIGQGGGGAFWGGLKNHKGPIDDIRIYNRTLSSQEIYQLYNMGK